LKVQDGKITALIKTYKKRKEKAAGSLPKKTSRRKKQNSR